MTDHHRAARQRLHADQAEQIAPLDIGAMLRVAWHGKWLILCAIFIVTSLSGYYAFRVAQPQYAATATLQLDLAGNPLQDTGQTRDIDEAALNTSVARVTSDAVLTNVIAQLDLLSDPEFNRYLAAARPLSLRSLRTTVRHFLAGTTAQDPDAAAVLEKTIQNLRGALAIARQNDSYILRITARSGDPAKAARLANATAAQYQAHTDTLRMQTQAEAEAWLQSRASELRSQLEAQQLQATSLIATAQLQEGSGLDSLSAQVLGADQQLSAARNALSALEGAPDRRSARTIAEIAQTRGKIEEITALKDRLSAQLSTQSAGQAQLQQIQLRIDTTRLLYQTFLGRLQEIRMQQGLTTPIAQRFNPAPDGVYVGPRKILILTIAAILGGTIGVALVAALTTLRKGAVDARSLRDATGLPVLAQLSSRALQSGGKAAPPHPALSHAIRGLLTSLSLTTQGRSAQVILSTSSVQAEGKTQLAVAVAQTLAKAGKRVVLIGADDGNRALAAATHSDVFKQAQANWRQWRGDAQGAALGADILVAPAFADHHDPLLSDQLADQIQTLRKTYDHIIIDGPPVLHAPEALLIARHADAIVYAVRWAKTPLAVVARGLDALAEAGSPATGLVLSMVNMRKMRKLSSDPCISAIHTPQVI